MSKETVREIRKGITEKDIDLDMSVPQIHGGSFRYRFVRIEEGAEDFNRAIYERIDDPVENPKDAENENYAYGVFRNYYLMHSRTFNRFPNKNEDVRFLRTLLGSNLGNYKEKLKKVKVEVLKQRIGEVFKDKGAISAAELQKNLGVKLGNYLGDLGYDSFSDMLFFYTGRKKVEIPVRKVFENNEKAYERFRDYYVKYLRKHHEFPLTEDVKKALKVSMKKDLSSYGIGLNGLKLDVVKIRLEEMYKEGDPTRDDINKELGLNIAEWSKRLGFSSFSEMRNHYTGKETRKKYRKFENKEEAFQEFENYFLKEMKRGQRLPLLKAAERHLKTHLKTYFNPDDERKIKVRALRQRIEELGGDLNFRRRKIQTALGIDLENWPEILGYKNFMDFKKNRKRFVENMSGESIEEKNKKFITYANLIRHAVKPGTEKTSEEEMWKFVKEKTGSPPSTSDIINVKNYLLYLNEIKGSLLDGGYSRSD